MSIILQGVVGSTAYGFANENSDIDRLGVFQIRTREYLGRFNKGETSADSVVQTDPDIQWHELGKFVRLASEMNPTVTELLWLPQYEITTWAGLYLVEHRDLFLSQDRIRARYGGYARRQIKRLLDRGDFGSDLKKRQAKHGRHVARLLVQGGQLLREGRLDVRLSEQDAEMCIKMGEAAAADPESFATAMEPHLVELDEIPSDLPAQPDLEGIRAVLVELREQDLADDEESYLM
jgi:predicted nucleotidyltransferase